MAATYITCRVQTGRGVQCTAEAVDPAAKLKICTRHLAEAMELLDNAMGRVPKPRKTQGS